MMLGAVFQHRCEIGGGGDVVDIKIDTVVVRGDTGVTVGAQ